MAAATAAAARSDRRSHRSVVVTEACPERNAAADRSPPLAVIPAETNARRRSCGTTGTTAAAATWATARPIA